MGKDFKSGTATPGICWYELSSFGRAIQNTTVSQTATWKPSSMRPPAGRARPRGC